MQRSRERIGTCPICSQGKLLSKDHVPPKGVFLPPRPTNTITVWTCQCCNQGTKLDDEYFRLYIASSADPGTEHYRLWKEKVVASTLRRSPKLHAALVEDMKVMLEHHRIDPLTTIDGRSLTDEEASRALPLVTDRIDRIVTKIIRCLHAHHHGTPLDQVALLSVSTEPFSESELKLFIGERSGLIGGELGEFIYRYMRIEEMNGWNWDLLFYLSHRFRITVRMP
jgi:hypothetical protein